MELGKGGTNRSNGDTSPPVSDQTLFVVINLSGGSMIAVVVGVGAISLVCGIAGTCTGDLSSSRAWRLDRPRGESVRFGFGKELG